MCMRCVQPRKGDAGMNWIEWNLKMESLRKMEREAYRAYLDAPEGMARAVAGTDWSHKQRALDDHTAAPPEVPP